MKLLAQLFSLFAQLWLVPVFILIVCFRAIQYTSEALGCLFEDASQILEDLGAWIVSRFTGY